MIKFFRHIRKRLLSEGKTGKYFKYAIGEILLVMIGILLALQANNWNNSRLEANREQTILRNLRSDFNDNLTELNRIYEGTEESYRSSVRLLEIIKGESPINPEEVEALLNSIINGFFSLDLNSASIDEIINSGSLSILKDVKLREHISNWPFIVSDSEDDIEIYYDYMFNFLIPSLSNKTTLRNTAIPAFLMKRLDIPQVSRSKFKLDYNKTLRALEFENEIYVNALNLVYVLDNYKKIEAYLNDTLKLIESNIE
ncbi:MAG: hypothetical protein CMB99_02070 [Flavobacteriaceae bacterium]|nr:hypothetical protein [Flavobacteriaceae bacterium]|tara:strand:- start:57050 stop:57817 length:768 start_codon:yes stop_codon:yes gene_type:complete